MKIKMPRLDRDTKVVYFFWALYSLSFFFLQQTEFNYMYNTSGLFQGISIFVGAGLIIFFVLSKKLNIKQLIVYLISGIVVIFTFTSMNDKYLLVAIGFMLVARRIDIRRFIEFDFCIKVFILVTVLFLCLSGVIPNYSRWIGDVYKQAYGFSHPNGLTGIVLIIFLEWFCIRFEKLNLWDFAVVAGGVWCVWNVAASRTSTYSFCAIYILVIIVKNFPDLFQNKIVKNMIALLPVIISIISFTLLSMYRTGNYMTLILDQLLTKRFLQATRLLDQYGVSLFGQFINVRGTRTEIYSADALFNVDMSYIIIPIRYGIFIFILLLIGYFFFIRKLIDDKKNMLIISIIYFTIIGFAETYFYRMQYNFTLMFLLMYVGYGRRNKR